MKFDPKRAKQDVLSYFDEGARVRVQAGNSCADQVVTAAELVAKAMFQGGKLLLCGNGGSAADCQHMAAEFVSRLTKDFIRPSMPAIALTTDTSFLTAFGNDCGFAGVFERQLEGLGKSGDVLIGISTSGNSENIVRAVNTAKKMKIGTIALCGEGGKLAELADVAICVPSKNTQFVQETHLAVEHLICSLVERAMYG